MLRLLLVAPLPSVSCRMACQSAHPTSTMKSAKSLQPLMFTPKLADTRDVNTSPLIMLAPSRVIHCSVAAKGVAP
jgi:hypothetical protein